MGSSIADGHKILGTTFWSKNFGHKILVTHVGHTSFVTKIFTKCLTQNFVNFMPRKIVIKKSLCYQNQLA